MVGSRTVVRGAFLVVLVAMVMVNSTQFEDDSAVVEGLGDDMGGDFGESAFADLAKGKKKKNSKKKAPTMSKGKVKRKAKKLPGTDQQGMKVIEEFEKYNGKLLKTQKKLRYKLAHPPAAVKGVSYQAVPGFAYAFQSRTMKDKSRAQCEIVCNTYSACKSYSYNTKNRKCMWSLSHVKYDPAYTLFAKKLGPGAGHEAELYSKLPGMLVQDARKKAVKDQSFQECKYACTKDSSCQTFSWSKEHLTCIKTGQNLHYKDGWTYYEKNIPLSVAYKKARGNEHAKKDKIRKRWIQASTSISRATLEKRAKVITKLKTARAKAVRREKAEKLARKNAAIDSTKCEAVTARLSGALKKNFMLQSSVEKKNKYTIKLYASKEKAKKAVTKPKHFESKSKAKLAFTITKQRHAESGQKYHAFKKMEAKQKKTMKLVSETKTKMCAAKTQMKNLLKKKEAKMKSAEGKAKQQAKKKKSMLAKRNYKKASFHLKLANVDERHAKMFVANKKQTLEHARKADRNASTEKGRKARIAERKADKVKYVAAKKKLRKVDKKQLTAKEKHFKQKKVYDLWLEKDKKAKALIKKRKKEAKQKMKLMKQRKLDLAKKEAKGKKEKKDKAIKKRELVKKKIKLQAKKARARVKALRMAESNTKIALHKKAEAFRRLQNAKEIKKKKDTKHRKMVAYLRKHELALKADARTKKVKKESMGKKLAALKRRSDEAAKKKKAANVKARKAAEVHGKTVKKVKATTSEKGQKAAKIAMINAASKARLSRERVKKAQAHKNERASKGGKLGKKMLTFQCKTMCKRAAKARKIAAIRNAALKLKKKVLKHKVQRGSRRRRATEDLGESDDKKHARKAGSKGLKRKKKVPTVPVRRGKTHKKPSKAFGYKGCWCTGKE